MRERGERCYDSALRSPGPARPRPALTGTSRPRTDRPPDRHPRIISYLIGSCVRLSVANSRTQEGGGQRLETGGGAPNGGGRFEARSPIHDFCAVRARCGDKSLGREGAEVVSARSLEVGEGAAVVSRYWEEFRERSGQATRIRPLANRPHSSRLMGERGITCQEGNLANCRKSLFFEVRCPFWGALRRRSVQFVHLERVLGSRWSAGVGVRRSGGGASGVAFCRGRERRRPHMLW